MTQFNQIINHRLIVTFVHLFMTKVLNVLRRSVIGLWLLHLFIFLFWLLNLPLQLFPTFLCLFFAIKVTSSKFHELIFVLIFIILCNISHLDTNNNKIKDKWYHDLQIITDSVLIISELSQHLIWKIISAGCPSSSALTTPTTLTSCDSCHRHLSTFCPLCDPTQTVPQHLPPYFHHHHRSHHLIQNHHHLKMKTEKFIYHIWPPRR